MHHQLKRGVHDNRYFPLIRHWYIVRRPQFEISSELPANTGTPCVGDEIISGHALATQPSTGHLHSRINLRGEPCNPVDSWKLNVNDYNWKSLPSQLPSRVFCCCAFLIPIGNWLPPSGVLIFHFIVLLIYEN